MEAIGKYLRRGRKIIFSKYKCYSPRNSTNKFKNVKTYSFVILLLGPIEMQYLGIRSYPPIALQL